MNNKDSMRGICIQQGYVPATCTLDGMSIISLVNKGECPCDGCNMNRIICYGTRRTYDNYNETDKLMSFLDILDETERKEREERKKRYEEMVYQRKQGHIEGYTRTILEIKWEIDREGYKMECVVKDIVDEKAYVIERKYINEIITIIPMICEKYKVEQIHIEIGNNIGGAFYEEILKLQISNVDIVPLRYSRLKLN